MGWFDEQIKQRIQTDDEAFSNAMAGMADVVMGERLARSFNDSSIQTKNAIDEIMKYYHVKVVELPDSVQGMDDQLEYLMRTSGIMRRTVNLDDEWYKDCIGAMLGTKKADGTPIAILPHGLFYTYFDTASGNRIRINKHTAKEIDREALCFYKPLPMKKLGITDLLKYIMGYLRMSDLIMAAVGALLVSLVGLLIPKINSIIYGTVISSTNMQLLFSIFSFLICVNVSQAMIKVIQDLYVQKITDRMDLAVNASSMIRVLSLPPSFFKNYSSGELGARLQYLSTLCSSLAGSFLSGSLTVIFSLVYITQMVQYGPGLVIPAMLVILFTVAFSIAEVFEEMDLMEKTIRETSKESGLSYSLIAGIQKIKLAGAEKRAFAKWAAAYQKEAKVMYDPPWLHKMGPVITTTISLIGTIVIYYYAITTSISMTDYFAFNAAYAMVMGAFTELVTMAGTIGQVRPILHVVQPILEEVPEVSENKKIVTHLSGGIELNNISFRYEPTTPMIIDNLSLKIHPGQYVAIVGSTGCGKSTLMRLMLGFEKPQRGAVYYDGMDLDSLDPKSLRRHIGTVMQDGKLFTGDLYSNIVITAPQMDMNAAWEAAEMAGIADDIRKMPMGMQTYVTEGSGGISGGQRQRIMIARAIVGKPRILIFDEATSALDNLTQKTVSESLAKLKCTRVVIAHRLSTIKNCDRIIVLDQGHIIEDGTYNELIAKKGFFAELVERQRLETDKDAQ